jgi:hypothetical protein
MALPITLVGRFWLKEILCFQLRLTPLHLVGINSSGQVDSAGAAFSVAHC